MRNSWCYCSAKRNLCAFTFGTVSSTRLISDITADGEVSGIHGNGVGRVTGGGLGNISSRACVCMVYRPMLARVHNGTMIQKD